MGKQKNKKQKADRLSKKDRNLYSAVFAIPVVIIALLVIGFEKASYLCTSLFSGDCYFTELNISFFSVLFFILCFVEAIYIVTAFEKAIDLGIPFKDYYLSKNKKVAAQIKRALIFSVCMAIALAVSFVLAGQSKTVATENQIVSYNLIKEDEVLIENGEVKEISVSVDMDYKPVGVKGIIAHSYYPVIELRTESGSVQLGANGFDYDYGKMVQYLSLFDESIIIKDKTDLESVHARNDYQKESLEKLFN